MEELSYDAILILREIADANDTGGMPDIGQLAAITKLLLTRVVDIIETLRRYGYIAT